MTCWALSSSSTSTSSNSRHRSFNTFSNSGLGHSGIFGSGTFSFGLSFLGIVGTSFNVAEFADIRWRTASLGATDAVFYALSSLRASGGRVLDTPEL